MNAKEKNTLRRPDYVFETSWEVCNMVGGIYTVLSTRAQSLKADFGDNLIFIGPDLWQGQVHKLFVEDKKLLSDWRQAASKAGLPIRIGRWQVPGKPIAALVDFQACFAQKNEIYYRAWEHFSVNSLNAYGDYDEASMFSYAAGRFAEIVIKTFLQQKAVVYQAHEWMSGLGMLFLKQACPKVATIFTTHATSIGRSIAGNNKDLYEYFTGYHGDQMADELSMQAKHSIEKQSAHRADCFTTVSDFTDAECAQLLDKAADVVLPNGFELDFVPKGSAFTQTRRKARKTIFDVAHALTGEHLGEDTLIVSTSGRNDFRCKGFDLYLESLKQLNENLRGTQQRVLALIEVPCWVLAARTDLKQRLHTLQQKSTTDFDQALPLPIITHDLHNLNEDRILCLMRSLGLDNRAENAVKVLLMPCYLNGNDGIFDMEYYDLLAANDLTIYPSYYEPWGYTPLESVAFKTPCITTNLSGFGQWVNSVLGREGTIKDGVLVLARNDRNYHSCATEICNCILDFLNSNKDERNKMRKKAAAFADKAQWKHFVQHYYKAYDFALNQIQKQ